jgi:uncharacterized membrane protein YebE (DUF533 family)
MDFKSILGAVLESGLAPSASQRMGHAMSPQGGGLGSLLGGLTGRAGQGGSDITSALGGLLSNAKQAASDTRAQAQAGNPMAVGGLGALAGAVLGGLRGSPARGAVGGAALAVLGQIAMQALQKGMGASGGAQSGLAEAGISTSVGGHQQASAETAIEDEASAELLLRAMINAAKADGQIDGSEMNQILLKLDEAGADQEAKDFVLAEMRRPLDLDGLVARVRTPGLAAAVYAASTMAIKVDTPAEQNYLAQLATRLGIPPQVRASLDASLGVGRA